MANSNKNVLSKLDDQANFCKSDAKCIIIPLFLPPADLLHGVLSPLHELDLSMELPVMCRSPQYTAQELLVLGCTV